MKSTPTPTDSTGTVSQVKGEDTPNHARATMRDPNTGKLVNSPEEFEQTQNDQNTRKDG
jgi:hypothetical protein